VDGEASAGSRVVGYGRRVYMSDALPHLMTVAAFLGWETPDGSDRWELIDGVPEAMAPSSPRHVLVHAEAARILCNHLTEQPHCRVVTRPGVQPRAGRDN
jgi:Uma2 family endonuclease